MALHWSCSINPTLQPTHFNITTYGLWFPTESRLVEHGKEENKSPGLSEYILLCTFMELEGIITLRFCKVCRMCYSSLPHRGLLLVSPSFQLFKCLKKLWMWEQWYVLYYRTTTIVVPICDVDGRRQRKLKTFASHSVVVYFKIQCSAQRIE